MRQFLNHLVSRLRQGNRGRARPATARPFRPSVEALEDRLTPTILFQPQFGADTLATTPNGPLLSSARVSLIFEGSYWNNPTGITRQDVINTVNEILGSSYLNGAIQYGATGTGSLVSTANDTSMPVASNNSFTESDLKAAAGRHVAATLTAPADEPIYFVVTAPGITDSTRPGLGGFHNELTYDATLTVGFFQVPVPEKAPFGWLGINGSSRSRQIDSFSDIFSHEVAESVTDPYLHSAAAVQVEHGSSFNDPDDTVDEIADFEPDGARYTYRLGNGALVQAYWSQQAQQYVVADGTSQTFEMTPRYGTKLVNGVSVPDQNQFFGNFDLTVNGDQLANKNDTISIDTIASGAQAGGVQVTLNGEVVTFDPGRIHSITINGGTGNDTVNINGLPAGVTLNVNLGNGTDSLVFGAATDQLDGVQGTVNIQGGGSNTTVTLQDQGTVNNWHIVSTSHNIDYVFANNSLTRYDTVVQRLPGIWQSTQYLYTNIHFSGVGHVVVFAGNCTNRFDDQSTSFNVPLSLYGTSGSTLNFDDSVEANNVSTQYTLTSTSITRVGTDRILLLGHQLLLRHTAAANFYSVPVVNVYGGTTASEFDVQGTAGGTQVNLYVGATSSTVQVGTASQSGGPILGALDVFGMGDTSLVVNDTATANAPGLNNNVAFTLTPGSVVRTDTVTLTTAWGIFTHSTTATIDYVGIGSLLVKGGSSGNRFTVQGTTSGTATTIDSGAGNDEVDVLATAANGRLVIDGTGGNDLVRLGSLSQGPGDTAAHAGTLANLLGNVTVNNTGGTTSLVLDDSGDTVSHSGVDFDPMSHLFGVAPADITWSTGPATLYLPPGS
jgi:hypothetical protein